MLGRPIRRPLQERRARRPRRLHLAEALAAGPSSGRAPGSAQGARLGRQVATASLLPSGHAIATACPTGSAVAEGYRRRLSKRRLSRGKRRGLERSPARGLDRERTREGSPREGVAPRETKGSRSKMSPAPSRATGTRRSACTLGSEKRPDASAVATNTLYGAADAGSGHHPTLPPPPLAATAVTLVPSEDSATGAPKVPCSIALA